MMASDENFQADIKLMKMAVVRRVAPDCNNLCDCGRAERRPARGAVWGQWVGGGRRLCARRFNCCFSSFGLKIG